MIKWLSRLVVLGVAIPMYPVTLALGLVFGMIQITYDYVKHVVGLWRAA